MLNDYPRFHVRFSGEASQFIGSQGTEFASQGISDEQGFALPIFPEEYFYVDIIGKLDVHKAEV